MRLSDVAEEIEQEIGEQFAWCDIFDIKGCSKL